MILDDLYKKKLIAPPDWLVSNTHYVVTMGSQAYGCAIDDSDYDLYGFAIPRKNDVFPHLKGEILGFGKQHQRFEQYQQHHIVDESNNRNYDITIFGIVKFFQLCMENNPNMVDALFVKQHSILHCSPIGQIVRDNRTIFLHKGAYHKFRGYSFSQLNKAKSTNREGKRKEIVEKYGYDLKFAAHTIRLADECYQILAEGDLDLTRSAEVLKSIRRGEWTFEQVQDYFNTKEKQLDELYHSSKLPYGPDEEKIKNLLLQCLEHHYGSLEKAVVDVNKAEKAIEEIKNIIAESGF